MALHRRSKKPRERTPLPPVNTGASSTLDVGGRRLGTLGMSWLTVTCACGHEGKVQVAELSDRHDAEIRVRDATKTLQCSQCGQARIRKITLIS